MTTTHIKNGVEYQIGTVNSPNGKSFDITVYFQFPTTEDYENDNDDVKLVGWHFGEYSPEVADQHIK